MRNQRISVKVNPVKKLKSQNGEEGETAKAEGICWGSGVVFLEEE